MADITYNISAGSVISVPIDDTLSIAGEAADAKAVGDALAEKADRSEIQTQVTVNGQSADQSGNILVSGDEITLTDLSSTTVKSAIDSLDAKAGDTILYQVGGADTIKEKLDALQLGKAAASAGVPLGGTAGQVLAKRSSTDRDLQWASPATINDTTTSQTEAWSGYKTNEEIEAVADDVSDLKTTVSGHNTAITNLQTAVTAKASAATATVSLTTSGWVAGATGYTQTKSVPIVTASNTVLTSPAPNSYAEYHACECRCSAQASGSLTFYAETLPTSALTVNVLAIS